MDLQLVRGRQSPLYFLWNKLPLGFLAVSVLWMPHKGLSSTVAIAE